MLQLVAGSVAVQSTVPPELKVMVPVAPVGRPGANSVITLPLCVLFGETFTVIVVSALMTVNDAPLAVATL